MFHQVADEVVAAVNPSPPKEEEEMLEEANVTPVSFAPQGFVFQPPSGLRTFQPTPLSPRSADAFLSPRYFIHLSVKCPRRCSFLTRISFRHTIWSWLHFGVHSFMVLLSTASQLNPGWNLWAQFLNHLILPLLLLFPHLHPACPNLVLPLLLSLLLLPYPLPHLPLLLPLLPHLLRLFLFHLLPLYRPSLSMTCPISGEIYCLYFVCVYSWVCGMCWTCACMCSTGQ